MCAPRRSIDTSKRAHNSGFWKYAPLAGEHGHLTPGEIPPSSQQIANVFLLILLPSEQIDALKYLFNLHNLHYGRCPLALSACFGSVQVGIRLSSAGFAFKHFMKPRLVGRCLHILSKDSRWKQIRHAPKHDNNVQIT